MSSEGCRCGLATNVIWKAVPGSRSRICEGPLTELGKCTRQDIVRVMEVSQGSGVCAWSCCDLANGNKTCPRLFTHVISF